MAQTLLSDHISGVYDKLVFQKEDGKLYYSDTAGNVDVLMFGNLEDVSLSAWGGTTNIITLGAIGAGTWNATTISVNKGGSGQTSYTNGQLLIGNTTGNTLAKGTITGTANEVDVTLGTGTIQIGLPDDVTIGNNLTIGGDRLVFDDGARLDMPDANTLQFGYTDKYRFIATDSVGDCIVELVADGGAVNSDWFRINAKDGGDLTFQNKTSGAFLDTLTINKSGVLAVHGNTIQNSDKENTLILTADQKIQIASNIIQNTSSEDVLELTGNQSLVIENDLFVKGDTMEFVEWNDSFVNISNGTIKANCDIFQIGTGFQPSKLFLVGGTSTDSTIAYVEGAAQKWEVGFDATDDSMVWSTGGSGLGTNDRMKLTEDGVLQLGASSANHARIELHADAGSSAADKWAIESNHLTNNLRIRNKISGLEQTYLSIIPHATPSSSEVTAAGFLSASTVKTDLIQEGAAAAGVTIDGTILKDDQITSPKGVFPLHVVNETKWMKMTTNNWYVHQVTSLVMQIVDPPSTTTITYKHFPCYIFKAPHPCKIVSAQWNSNTDGGSPIKGQLWKCTFADGGGTAATAVKVGSDYVPSGSAASKQYITTQTINETVAADEYFYFIFKRDNPVTTTVYSSIWLEFGSA